jgi:hypothetical protein
MHRPTRRNHRRRRERRLAQLPGLVRLGAAPDRFVEAFGENRLTPLLRRPRFESPSSAGTSTPATMRRLTTENSDRLRLMRSVRGRMGSCVLSSTPGYVRADHDGAGRCLVMRGRRYHIAAGRGPVRRRTTVAWGYRIPATWAHWPRQSVAWRVNESGAMNSTRRHGVSGTAPSCMATTCAIVTRQPDAWAAAGADPGTSWP